MNNQSEYKSEVDKIVFLKGEKVILRLVTQADATSFVTWINDPQISQYLSRAFPVDMKSERKWIDSLYPSENNIVFAVETVEGRLIGTMGLHKINLIDRTASTGAMIGDVSYHGKGYGTEAKMLLLEYAFNTLNLRKINSEVISFNERSIKYSLKCGYEIEGRQKAQVYKNGKYHDIVLLAIFKEKWASVFKEYKKTGNLCSTEITA